MSRSNSKIILALVQKRGYKGCVKKELNFCVFFHLKKKIPENSGMALHDYLSEQAVKFESIIIIEWEEI